MLEHPLPDDNGSSPRHGAFAVPGCAVGGRRELGGFDKQKSPAENRGALIADRE
jgi:hypothetical protein